MGNKEWGMHALHISALFMYMLHYSIWLNLKNTSSKIKLLVISWQWEQSIKSIVGAHLSMRICAAAHLRPVLTGPGRAIADVSLEILDFERDSVAGCGLEWPHLGRGSVTSLCGKKSEMIFLVNKKIHYHYSPKPISFLLQGTQAISSRHPHS